VIQSRVRFLLRACSRYRNASGFFSKISIGASSAAAFIDKHEQCMSGRRLCNSSCSIFHLALWVCFAAVCSKRLRFHSCSRLLQFLSRHCFITIIAVWVTCFVAIIASVCSIFHLACYLFTCGHFSPVWFRDRLFRRVLFEAFAVSFLFEAFVVSFSTLLQYNLLPWESLQYQIGYGQLVRIDPWLIDPWLCIWSFSRRNSNKIAHCALDNKVMSPDSCASAVAARAAAVAALAFRAADTSRSTRATLRLLLKQFCPRTHSKLERHNLCRSCHGRILSFSRHNNKKKENRTPFKQSVNMNCSASYDASMQLVPFLCHCGATSIIFFLCH